MLMAIDPRLLSLEWFIWRKKCERELEPDSLAMPFILKPIRFFKLKLLFLSVIFSIFLLILFHQSLILFQFLIKY